VSEGGGRVGRRELGARLGGTGYRGSSRVKKSRQDLLNRDRALSREGKFAQTTERESNSSFVTDVTEGLRSAEKASRLINPPPGGMNQTIGSSRRGKAGVTVQKGI